MPTSTEKDYAGFRAHQDMKDTNTLAKAAAQAAMLINGGAASAMLAFISNKDNAIRVSSTVAYSLSGLSEYALEQPHF